MTPFFASHYDPSTLYYAAHKIYKSPDRGDSWTCISPDLSTDPGPDQQGNVPYGTITSLSESVVQQGLLYAGADDGNVQVTKDDGKTWTLIREGLPRKWVSRVEASRFDRATVFASLTGYREDDFSAYLFVSHDYGQTWTSISGSLPAESVNVIREDAVFPDILNVGTDLGVYVSLDRGASWHSLCNHLPTTPVHDLVVHPRESEIVIGTHGRSCFVLEVAPVRAYLQQR
jgi:photosystem II stability/assembly factor-like uncharacterized protein